MKLGTIVYDNQIYNLDYMTSDEVKNILKIVESDKKREFSNAKKNT